MRFLIAVHPPLISPVLAAKMAQTFDDFSGGRVLLNIVNGNTAQMRAYGSTLGHDERYAYTDEWIEVWKKPWPEKTWIFMASILPPKAKP